MQKKKKEIQDGNTKCGLTIYIIIKYTTRIKQTKSDITKA